jgi:hypothetical protein
MSEMRPTNVEKLPMNAACEARVLIREIAGQAPIGTPIKSALARVARVTGLGERRIRGLWNQEARAILDDEMQALRRAARKATHEHEQASELRSAASQFESLANRLEAIDPDLYREEVAAYRALAFGARTLVPAKSVSEG